MGAATNSSINLADQLGARLGCVSVRPFAPASTRAVYFMDTWWLGRSLLDGREIQWIMAAGRGGQSIRVVPELDLVVVITDAPLLRRSCGLSRHIDLSSAQRPRL